MRKVTLTIRVRLKAVLLCKRPIYIQFGCLTRLDLYFKVKISSDLFCKNEAENITFMQRVLKRGSVRKSGRKYTVAHVTIKRRLAAAERISRFTQTQLDAPSSKSIL